MKNKKITTVADIQAEKIKIKEAYLIRETELNVKLNYLQNNFGSILIQTLSFKKNSNGEHHDSAHENGFLSSLIESITNISTSGSNGKMLLGLAKTALPAIIISLVKNYFKRKISK